MSMKQFVLILLLSVGWCGLVVAAKAPVFQLKDLDGNFVKLEEQQGKVVLISFWGTFCKPCKKELPELSKLHDELKDKGLVFFSINTDKSGATSLVCSFVKQYQYQFPVLLDVDSTVLEKYNPDRTLPFTVIIDREGNLVAKHSGYKAGDEAVIKKELEELLATTSSAEKGTTP